MRSHDRVRDVDLALRLNQGRRLIFGRSGVQTATEFAVTHAVEEINHEADCEPDEETDPCFQWQTEHQHEAKDHSKNGKDRHERRSTEQTTTAEGNLGDVA